MTLPTQINFPPEDNVREIVKTLAEMYENIAQAVNGDIREWTPKLVGLVTPGVGTYTRQTGWYLRQGIIVDLWFDLEWTAHTGVGAAYIELPYKVKNSQNFPWSGELNMSGITLGAGYTKLFLLAQPNTFFGLIFGEGSGVAFASLSIVTSGRLIGKIRYIGQEFEN